jgi:hypothetical protein
MSTGLGEKSHFDPLSRVSFRLFQRAVCALARRLVVDDRSFDHTA